MSFGSWETVFGKAVFGKAAKPRQKRHQITLTTDCLILDFFALASTILSSRFGKRDWLPQRLSLDLLVACSFDWHKFDWHKHDKFIDQGARHFQTDCEECWVYEKWKSLYHYWGW